MTQSHSFLWWEQPHCIHKPYFPYCSSVDGHLGWFHNLAAMGSAAANPDVTTCCGFFGANTKEGYTWGKMESSCGWICISLIASHVTVVCVSWLFVLHLLRTFCFYFFLSNFVTFFSFLGLIALTSIHSAVSNRSGKSQSRFPGVRS